MIGSTRTIASAVNMLLLPLCVLLLLLTFSKQENMQEGDCPKLSAYKGHILIFPRTMKCDFYDDTGVHMPDTLIDYGRYYGLVSYNCSNCYGSLISDFEGCDDCVFCTHNMMISKCEPSAALIALSVTLSLSLVLNSYLIITLLKKLGKLPNTLSIYWLLSRCLIKKDIKKQRQQLLLAKMTAELINEQKLMVDKIYEEIGNLPPSVSPTSDLDESKRTELEELAREKEARIEELSKELKALIGRKTIISEDGFLMRNTDYQESEKLNEDIYNLESQINKAKGIVRPGPLVVVKSQRYRGPSANSGFAMPVNQQNRKRWTPLAILTILLLPCVDCCDHTFYMTSTNKICTDKSCKEETHGFVTLTNDITLCFNMDDGSKTSMKLAFFDHFSVFKPVYFTTDYNIVLFHELRCQGSGDCWYNKCQTKGSSLSQSGLEKLLVQYNATRPRATDFPRGELCVSDSLCCWDCFRGTECAFIHWAIVPNGQLHTVYKPITTGWMALLEITNSNSATQHVLLSSDNNVIVAPFRMTVVSRDYTIPVTSNAILETPSRDFLFIDADPLNQPTLNHLGDYQISLDHLSHTFPTSSVSCSKKGCNAECETAPAFLKDFKTVNYGSVSATREGSYIKTRDPVKGTLTIMTIINTINNLYVKQAACDFALMTTIGCWGCSRQTKVIFSANNIHTEGLLFFTSNCSFDSNYLSCQISPQTLLVMGDPSVCEMFFDTTNSSLIFQINYLFTGDLSKREVLKVISTDASIDSSLSNLFSDGRFLPTFASTFLMTTIILVVIRVIAAYLSLKAEREASMRLRDHRGVIAAS